LVKEKNHREHGENKYRETFPLSPERKYSLAYTRARNIGVDLL
jgi:hypothetical protein